MGKLTRYVLIILAALALLPFSAVSADAAGSPKVAGIALDEQGQPLRNVFWNVYHQEGGEWVGLQMGPLLTDAAGRFEDSVDAGTGYRVCFSDSYYGLDYATESSYWFPEVRHRDTCWPDATSVESAQTWTAPADGTTTLTMTLPSEGLGMAPVDPFVVGAFEVGQPLTVVGQEGWRPTNATFSYQWYAYDGAASGPIAGATGATFTPTSAQDGKWVQAIVTASLPGYKPVRLGSQTNMVGALHAQLTSPLQITGTAAAGQTLTASFGQPTAAGHSILEWFVDGIPQPEATTQGSATSTFAVTSAMSGANIEARLSAYLTDADSNYIDGSSTYARAIVQAAGTRPTQPLSTAVTTAGKPTVGRVLTAPSGVTADPNATISYQWLRGTSVVTGATTARYKLRKADLGKPVQVQVTVNRPGWWNSYVGTSPATVVKKSLENGRLAVAGKARVGKRLTARATGWGPKPVKVRYQWLRDGQPIDHATKATYRVRKADKGTELQVRVTVTKKRYLAVTKTSKAKKVKR
ncbi:hypothetical protein [Nocardioides sp.]|uniref:hypothetical protein n=1 Tax=Nocardioides sp. TaxID=35761 RepID=UPI0039E3ABCA